MSTAPSSAEPESAPAPPAYHPRLRDWLRAGGRVFAVVTWTATIAAGLLVAWALARVRRTGDDAARAAIRRRAMAFWGRRVLAVLGVRSTTTGAPPPPGALVVSNHLSYLDIPVLASVLPVVFVSKAEVRRWPFWGSMATMAGTVYIDRTRKRDALRVLEGMERAMGRGDGVVVFPEATSTDGATILPFKASLLELAASRRAPVYWVTLSYRATEVGVRASDRVCWWGDMTFGRHLAGLCALRGVDCRIRFGDGPIQNAGRKALANDLRQAMLREHEPVE